MKTCACLRLSGPNGLQEAPGLREVAHGERECIAIWLDGSGPPVVIRAEPLPALSPCRLTVPWGFV